MKRIFSNLITLALLLCTFVLPTEKVQGHSGNVFSAFATVISVIDGQVSAGEWDDADCQTHTVNTSTGGTSDLTICVKNDVTNLYLLAIVTNQDYSDPLEPGFDFLNFTFDNDHDGQSEIGDDGLALRFDNNFVLDIFNPTGVCCHTSNDTFDAGTNDLSARLTHSNPVPDGLGTYIAEYQHPLDTSDDAHDFSLAPGDVVGFFFSMADGDDSGAFYWPSSSPANSADIIIASEESEELKVVIDIKPGNKRNHIHCRNPEEIIPVAILTTKVFDALTVDHTSVTFEGASEIYRDPQTGEPLRFAQDADKDRDLDLVFHFRLGDTTLSCKSKQGTIVGETFAGSAIIGSDIIRMVQKK